MRNVMSTLAELAGVTAVGAGLWVEIGAGWALVFVGAFLVTVGFIQGDR